MKQCPRCGAEIPDAVFCCPECNYALDVPQIKRDYDSYYEDVQPIDIAETKKRNSRAVAVWKVGLIVCGFVLAISACVAVLCLL